ncbi:MAG: lytic transglycosylase domain-containing protein [Candidatus Pacebacteria bacterium]|nr:lytic transglycosylase domain-containing protein [Candidatus Paceibacterota bacterium]
MIISHQHPRSSPKTESSDSTGLIRQIKATAQRQGVNFNYMLATASAESNFDTRARAQTSSAAGLYQFTSGTWLSLVKTYGANHGLGELAEQIDDQGRVADPQVREKILALRHEPKFAIEFGADFTRENQAYLEKTLERRVGGTELYLAHFLGAKQAGQFLSAVKNSPDMSAADLFPKAATANQSVFYTKAGEAKSVSEILALFTDKIQGKMNRFAAENPAATTTANSINGYTQFFMSQPNPASHTSDLGTRLLLSLLKSDREEDENLGKLSTLAPSLPSFDGQTGSAASTTPQFWQLAAYRGL